MGWTLEDAICLEERSRGLRRGCLTLELLIWLKQSMPGSVVPLAMFDAMLWANFI